MASLPRPLTEIEAMQADTIVWVGQLPCGCRPFSVADGPAGSEADDAWGILIGQSVQVEVYSPEDAKLVVAPCIHNVVTGAAS